MLLQECPTSLWILDYIPFVTPSDFCCLMDCLWNLVVQAILFLRFSDNRTEDFKGRIYKAARHYGTKNISFLVDDVSNPQGAFQVKRRNYFFLGKCPTYYQYSPNHFMGQILQYFKLNTSEVPLIFVRESNATYMKPNVEPDQILPWFKEYSVRSCFWWRHIHCVLFNHVHI